MRGAWAEQRAVGTGLGSRCPVSAGARLEQEAVQGCQGATPGGALEGGKGGTAEKKRWGGQLLTIWGGDVARPPTGTAVRLGAAGVQRELVVSGGDEMVKGASEGWGTEPPAALPVEKPRSPGGAGEKDPEGAD